MNEKPDTQLDDEKYRAPALSKGLDILELLASEADGMSQVEIAKHLGRTTSEIFRMLMVLSQRNYIAQRDGDDRYVLTTKMFEVAHRHPPTRRLTAIAGEAMQRLANEINQSMHLGILHAGRVLVIAQVDGPDNNITAVRLGANISIYDTASGRILAAWMDDTAREALFEQAGNAPAEKRQSFISDLPKVREAGCFQAPSLTIEGVVNISAPVFDFYGNVVAAVTIPFIRRLSGTSITDVDESRARLVAMAKDMSRRLGAGVAETEAP